MGLLEYTEHGFRCVTDTSRHHRENQWDYKRPGVYHITLVTEQRAHLFGKLCGDSSIDARIVLNGYGKKVKAMFSGIPEHYHDKGYKLKVLALCVMPDHLHGVIHVQNTMPVSIGEIVRGFKSACTSLYKREFYFNPEFRNFCRIFAARNSVWEYMPAGYHEKILHQEGQLRHMIDYVKDNPRRLWLKKNNPEFFRLHRNEAISFIDDKGITHSWHFKGMGNWMLLQHPSKQIIQCSRSITDEALTDYKNHILHNASCGTVSITAAISPGEKLIARTVREQGYPLIVILTEEIPTGNDAKSRYYKPGGVYFDACSAAQLLLIEPHPLVLQDNLIADNVEQIAPHLPQDTKRWHFLAYNNIAQQIVKLINN